MTDTWRMWASLQRMHHGVRSSNEVMSFAGRCSERGVCSGFQPQRHSRARPVAALNFTRSHCITNTSLLHPCISVMSEERSLRSVHEDAEQKRIALDNAISSATVSFQETLLATIALYEECLIIAGRISLFSPNESLEDVATADIQYLLLGYRIADLVLRINGGERKAHLHRAQASFERYLRQLDQYDMLDKEGMALLELYQEAPDTFSVASRGDAAARREVKIKRFKEEKALREKLEYLQSNTAALRNDDGAARQLFLAEVAYCTHHCFASLESIAQELHILALAPPPTPQDAAEPPPDDARRRTAGFNSPYSERLDAPLNHMSAGLRGPLIDKQGKPLRPFTLTPKRQEFANGVFRPDHSLPTMSIDEYLEEEQRRGGMISGGGPQSEIQPEVDEDDLELADRETMKARDWDEYVEANPRGSGNTINRG